MKTPNCVPNIVALNTMLLAFSADDGVEHLTTQSDNHSPLFASQALTEQPIPSVEARSSCIGPHALGSVVLEFITGWSTGTLQLIEGASWWG